MSLRLNCFGISTRVSAYLCLGILLLSACSAWGQTSTAGTVAGLVTDEQNAAIPAAAVKLTDPSTNAVLSSVTTNSFCTVARLHRWSIHASCCCASDRENPCHLRRPSHPSRENSSATPTPGSA